MKITETDIPSDSLTQDFLPADYSDAFKCTFISQEEISADDFQIAFWTHPTKWVDILFKIRNALVRVVGLNGGKFNDEEIKTCIKENKNHKLFSVACKSENETVLKLTDKHLNAHLSAYITEKNNCKTVNLITIVHFHNRLGYFYFNIIRPFHNIVVKGMMKHVIKSIYKL